MPRKSKADKRPVVDKWGDRLTWRSPWANDTSRFVGLAARPVLMDSGWFHDSSSHGAFGYTYLRRIIVFHHLSSVDDRRAYIREIEKTPVVDDLGVTITGGRLSDSAEPSETAVWIEYTRDHTSVY